MRFLECLETGLVPYGRLDPPLANERGGGTFFDQHEGKIVKQSLTRDYVFRLVPSVSPEDIGRSCVAHFLFFLLGVIFTLKFIIKTHLSLFLSA